MFVHGILEIEDVDKQGEVFVVGGVDLSKVGDKDEWERVYLDNLDAEIQPYNSLYNILGTVTEARAILSSRDCRGAADWALLDIAQGKPFIKVQASLLQWHNGPNPLEAALKSRERLYFAIQGHVLERQGNRLVKTVLQTVGVTEYPVHKALRVFAGAGD